jgi:hypothetical protein
MLTSKAPKDTERFVRLCYIARFRRSHSLRDNRLYMTEPSSGFDPTDEIYCSCVVRDQIRSQVLEQFDDHLLNRAAFLNGKGGLDVLSPVQRCNEGDNPVHGCKGS